MHECISVRHRNRQQKTAPEPMATSWARLISQQSTSHKGILGECAGNGWCLLRLGLLHDALAIKAKCDVDPQV